MQPGVKAARRARRAAVLKVARRGNDAHRRRRLALVVGSQLDDDGVGDKVKLLGVLVDGEARRAERARRLPQRVRVEELGQHA